MTDTNSIYNQLGVSDQVLRFGQEVLEGLTDQFRHIDQVAEFNQAKVIAAMQKNRVNATHFNLSTGYGYDDEGRDSGGSVLENQKIIYTGDINLETTAFDETVKALAALAEVKGGYLESSTVGGGSRGYRWADYTVRVPSAQFQGFLDQAGELAHVTWRNTNLENITETYYCLLYTSPSPRD